MLRLTSTIGLVLFLFLVGMEIDTRLIRRHIRSSAMISLAGLVVPLGLGAALGVAIYREFINPAVNFGYFLLFTAVAVGITAFPVLCRILPCFLQNDIGARKNAEFRVARNPSESQRASLVYICPRTPRPMVEPLINVSCLDRDFLDFTMLM